MKRALITGITGQDGSYLAEYLLETGYEVHGIKRRASMYNTARIDHLYNDPKYHERTLVLHHGDMTDFSSILSIVSKVKPHEIYNLAAQSHVAVSFEEPEYTANADALGTLRILEAIRIVDSSIKFYQASTSELYGKVQEVPQNENTEFYPRSPYGVAKLYGYWLVKNYRESYNIFAVNGILFNHESPRRGETFVTRKITLGINSFLNGNIKSIKLGNIYAKRDWGHAADYVRAMHLMLQNSEPIDYVVSTGIQYSIKEFVNKCWDALKIKYRWVGNGLEEKCLVEIQNEEKIAIEISKRLFRPSEVDSLLGDSTRIREELGWSTDKSIDELILEMLSNDIDDKWRPF